MNIVDAVNTILNSTPTFDNETQARYSCPFARKNHSGGFDTSGDFVVFKETKSYYCFACEESGTLHKLKELFAKGITDEELDLLLLSSYLSIFNPKDHHDPPLDLDIYINVFSPVESSKSSMNYLLKRNISLATANKLGLQYSDYHDAITFPIYDLQSNLHGFQCRFINNNDIKIIGFVAKVGKYLLGAQLVDRKKPSLIVEGLFAYAHLHEIGADKLFNILAVMGSKLTSYKIELLKHINNPIYILPDNDLAGKRMIYKKDKDVINDAVYELSKGLDVYLPSWPKGKKDPDQLNYPDIRNMRYNTNKIASVKQYSFFS